MMESNNPGEFMDCSIKLDIKTEKAVFQKNRKAQVEYINTLSSLTLDRKDLNFFFQKEKAKLNRKLASFKADKAQFTQDKIKIRHDLEHRRACTAHAKPTSTSGLLEWSAPVLQQYPVSQDVGILFATPVVETDNSVLNDDESIARKKGMSKSMNELTQAEVLSSMTTLKSPHSSASFDGQWECGDTVGHHLTIANKQTVTPRISITAVNEHEVNREEEVLVERSRFLSVPDENWLSNEEVDTSVTLPPQPESPRLNARRKRRDTPPEHALSLHLDRLASINQTTSGELSYREGSRDLSSAVEFFRRHSSCSPGRRSTTAPVNLQKSQDGSLDNKQVRSHKIDLSEPSSSKLEFIRKALSPGPIPGQPSPSSEFIRERLATVSGAESARELLLKRHQTSRKTLGTLTSPPRSRSRSRTPSPRRSHECLVSISETDELKAENIRTALLRENANADKGSVLDKSPDRLPPI